jgi:leucyl-tRNA synthetase
MKMLIPFVPHLAHECLEQLNVKDFSTWPQVDVNLIAEEKTKIAIQINGKTRDIIEVKKDSDEKSVINETRTIKKINDHLNKTEILKIIFVKNKIINYLTK